MAKDILKEAIADAKAVREVALANAKAALEEAFTPRLQSMLSAKLSETLNEEEEDLDENYMEGEDTVDEGEDMEETMDEGEDMEETMDETYDEGENLDEEIDLEEILNELELEEAKDEDKDKVDEAKDDDLDEAKDMDEETMDEAKDDDLDEAKKDDKKELDEQKPIYSAEYANDPSYAADHVHEGETFDLDALLEEINNLDEKKDEDDVKEAKDMDEETMDETYMDEEMDEDMDEGFGNVNPVTGGSFGGPKKSEFAADARDLAKNASSYEDWQAKMKDLWTNYKGEKPPAQGVANMIKSPNWKNYVNKVMAETELEEVKAALEVKSAELNEVNLLNSKLLYVNRIFKANTLDEVQKLRVVETLDKAETSKEAKLIYETIKDTFNVAKSKKASFKSKTKSLKEGIGMASKTVGTTAPKKEVISESNNMINRFQKLANIKINQ